MRCELILGCRRRAVAGTTKASRSSALKLTDIDVGDFAGVAQDKIVNLRFTQAIDPTSVNPATIQVRAQNALGTGFAIEVPGTFQVAASL